MSDVDQKMLRRFLAYDIEDDVVDILYNSKGLYTRAMHLDLFDALLEARNELVINGMVTGALDWLIRRTYNNYMAGMREVKLLRAIIDNDIHLFRDMYLWEPNPTQG